MSGADISVGGTPVGLVADALAAPQRTLEPLAGGAGAAGGTGAGTGRRRNGRAAAPLSSWPPAPCLRVAQAHHGDLCGQRFSRCDLAVNSVPADRPPLWQHAPGGAPGTLPGDAMAAALPPGGRAVSAALRGPELLLPWNPAGGPPFQPYPGPVCRGFLVVALVAAAACVVLVDSRTIYGRCENVDVDTHKLGTAQSRRRHGGGHRARRHHSARPRASDGGIRSSKHPAAVTPAGWRSGAEDHQGAEQYWRHPAPRRADAQPVR